MRSGIRSAAVALSTIAALHAVAQVPPDLADGKTFRAFKSSSADPTGKNGDARGIGPGETLTLSDIAGNGRLTHIWFTIAAQDKDHLRELVLRIIWDDAKRPAVECPIGDFFAQGPGKYVEFQSSAVSVGGQMALNCYWPMPFKKRAVITVTNEGAGRVNAFYYNIDYRLEMRPLRDIRYFHTQYRNYFPAPEGTPLTIGDIQGSGHYVGTIVTVLTNSDGWWGEGDDNFYVDGSKSPSLSGTGTEDYFCGAWDFGHTFQTPSFGVTYYDNADHGGEKRGISNTVYRWHIQDPIPFTKSLLFTLEHGRAGWDEKRSPYSNHYTTVGLYYSDRAEGEGPVINPYSRRVPTLIGS
ncbi:MAG: DUF2961 domain-containing protein [Fimbriimonadaceae bacterium]|nr:DUF2961 domain-containing protein [Fimbriimonadaceae bacterium]